ncbi:MAG: hypothetical protein DWQ49_09840 [Bacteroidetes bacterium]|nr:MAG: hypothetical protein DWQ49_09840 [Bacteroidota bacterium]
MAFELNENQMMIFRNRNRDAERNQCTHVGSVKVDGKEYWVNCWLKEGKNGKFFSCALNRKEEKPATTVPDTEIDDDIPF